MAKDSEVTADLADKDVEAQYFNTLKYASAIGDGSWENNPKILEEMRGATGEITDFTSKPNYFLKTIDKEWAETKEGKKKIAIADGIIESLNKNSSDKEYYKIIDGRKKEVIIASNPKAKSYVYHLGKSISAPFRTDEYKVSSFNPNRSFTDDVKELTGIVLGGLSDLSKPFTLGIGSKLGDESGRVGKGSSQYGTREVIEGKQEFIRSSVESATDMVVTPIVMRSVGVGISKGKEVIRKYKSYDLEYSASIAQKATDTYHKTPVQFDEFLIKNGTSYIRNDGRIEYMMKGYVNGREGIYHITVKDGNIIIHKDFLPMHRWEEFRVKYELPKYDKIK